ncbi:MAG TPA: xanthine dehydrogenase family protein molybdopterin-binding subunit [Chloroflexota bacterium]|nr:xanthine dehydrogenase family protein molybdopterin-binding subunit [Chloroflexota bacterium]
MGKVVKSEVEYEGNIGEHLTIIEGPEPEPWSQEAKLQTVGKSVDRVDAYEKATGRAQYTSDIHPSGMVYGKILRSPYPHARIVSIDTSRAELLPGVRGVLSPINAPSIRWKDGKLVLDTVLNFVGDEIAVVAADDEETAQDAVDLIRVQYEELPFVLDPEQAMQPDAPRVHPSGNLADGKPRVYERGDMKAGLSQAEVTVEETFRTQVALHNSMETHGTVANWVGEDLTVWDSTQGVFVARAEIAAILGLPLNRVRVISHYIGGGFGSKLEINKQTILAALLARQIQRPVRIVLSRHEENLITGHRHPTAQTLKLGARQDGSLTAIHLHCVVPVGAYGYAASIAGPAMQLYDCPNVHTEVYAVYTNDGPARAFRAPGYTEGTFALESAMDMLADRLGMDPLELRLKNYADKDPLTGHDYSAKHLREVYQLAAEKAGWAKRHPAGTTQAGQGAPFTTKKLGIGMATQIWGGGGGPPAYAIVKLNPDGTADVVTGSQDIGSGTATGLAQIAAEALGFTIENVHVSEGDTRDAPYSPTSGGSQTISSTGPAVRAAAEDAREELLEVASQVMEISRDQLQVKDNRIYVAGSSENGRPVSEVLGSLGNAMIVGRGSRGPNPPGYAIRTFGAQFAEVEVDEETGRIRLLQIVAVHDFGRVINPKLAENQIQGGITQGIGYSVMEERVIDARNGRVLNPDLEEYLIPTSMDTSSIEVAVIGDPDQHSNNLGAKGIGEPPIIPTAPAIANAVFNATGTRLLNLPMSVRTLLKKRSTP